MKRELFSIGSITIYGYGLMISIGFIVALVIASFRAKRRNLNTDTVIDIALWALVCGVIGAKILYIIVNFNDFLSEPLAVLGSSGFVIYGGIIGGAIAAILYCRSKKVDFMEYFDLIMPEVSIAQGFGRIGCFLAGCCYGRETSSCLGVIFPSGGLAPSGVKLLPTQLISAAGDFLIAAILIIAANRFKSNKTEKSFGVKGDIGSLYMILYGIGRFIIEFFRNDYRGEVGILSTSQFISLFIVAFGIIIMAVNRKRIKKAE